MTGQHKEKEKRCTTRPVPIAGEVDTKVRGGLCQRPTPNGPQKLEGSLSSDQQEGNEMMRLKWRSKDRRSGPWKMLKIWQKTVEEESTLSRGTNWETRKVVSGEVCPEFRRNKGGNCQGLETSERSQRHTQGRTRTLAGATKSPKKTKTNRGKRKYRKEEKTYGGEKRRGLSVQLPFDYDRKGQTVGNSLSKGRSGQDSRGGHETKKATTDWPAGGDNVFDRASIKTSRLKGQHGDEKEWEEKSD